MTVRTCTKRMPALVRQHPAGQWWNFGIVPPTIYTSPKLVSSAFSKKLRKLLHFPYPGGFARSFLVPGITKAGTATTWSQGQEMRAKLTSG
jgi:hypothetical protein